MNPVDIAGIFPELLKLGLAGVMIIWLLWERRNMVIDHKAAMDAVSSRLASCQEAHMADIKSFARDMTAALTTSSELIRSNNEIQNRATVSAAQIAEAVREVSSTLESLEKRIEQRSYRQ